MFARWLPFVSGVVLQFMFVGFGFYGLLGLRAMSLADSINIEHCTQNGLEHFQQSIELCAYAAAAAFMNEPHFLARMFVVLVMVATTLGWLTSVWGKRNNNIAMFFVSIVGAALILSALDRAVIAAIAVFFGHSLGWLLASRK